MSPRMPPRLARALVAVSMISGCSASTRGSAREAHCEVERQNPVRTRADETLPQRMLPRVANTASRDASGHSHFWVRRLGGQGISITEPVVRDENASGPPPARIVRTEFHVDCVPFDVVDVADRHSFRLSLETEPETFFVTFDVDRDRNGSSWTVHGPELLTRSRRFALYGSCSARLANDPTAVPDDRSPSRGDQLFTSRARCDAFPRAVTKRCEGGDCRWDESSAAPFALGDCDDELTRIRSRAALVIGASHAASERTMRAFDHLARGGGTLWHRNRQTTRCEAVSVRPASRGATRLMERWAAPSGDTGIEDLVIDAEPLFHRAIEVSRRSEVHYAGGSFGGGGSNPGGSMTLEFGDGVLLLGDGDYFLERSRCEAEAPGRTE